MSYIPVLDFVLSGKKEENRKVTKYKHQKIQFEW